MQRNSIEEKKFVTVMIKMVGNNCNMNCEYCYEHGNRNVYDKFSTSIQVIEYLKKFTEYERIFIVFHGGEPLLAPKNEVRNILDFIKKNFINEYKIQIQTNGTLIDDEWIKMFQQFEPNLSLSLSLDPVGKQDLRRMNNGEYRSIVEGNLRKYSGDIKNIGVISVAHKFNRYAFKKFIRFLIDIGIKNLTINKFRAVNEDDKAYLSEKEYVEMLEDIFIFWVSNGLYKLINIQPLNSLFSLNGNKICIYLADKRKCSYFKTFYSEQKQSNCCDHICNDEIPCIDRKCLECDIYSKCGGGCVTEFKDETYCDARRRLFEFIEVIKYGSK